MSVTTHLISQYTNTNHYHSLIFVPNTTISFALKNTRDLSRLVALDVKLASNLLIETAHHEIAVIFCAFSQVEVEQLTRIFAELGFIMRF